MIWYHCTMVRTRDLLLFVGALVFLLCSIFITLIKEHGGVISKGTPVQFNVASGSSLSFSATTDTQQVDRQANIERLRKELAKTDMVIVGPSLDQSDIPSNATTTEQTKPEGRTIQSCTGDDTISRIQNWPKNNVSIKNQDSMRQIVHTVETSSSSASTTVITTILMNIPQNPLVTGSAHCVPSDVIGVTLSGKLMRNADTQFYRAYGPNYLIGYARDGFPIYGSYGGETDSCGGYMDPSGYRYSITPKNDFIVGCFVADPAMLMGF